MWAVIGVATSTGLINSIVSSDRKTIVDGSDITILTKLIQKINDTKLTFLKETKMLFFTLDVVLESVLLRKYINKKETTSKLDFKLDISENIGNKNVIIVEDIIDSGITLSYLYD